MEIGYKKALKEVLKEIEKREKEIDDLDEKVLDYTKESAFRLAQMSETLRLSKTLEEAEKNWRILENIIKNIAEGRERLLRDRQYEVDVLGGFWAVYSLAVEELRKVYEEEK